MPGAYCRYCDHRCFVDRVLPDTGRRLHMATCPAGKAHDRTVSGFDADTAINPFTNPLPQDQRRCRCGQPATANAYGHSCDQWPSCEGPMSDLPPAQRSLKNV